MKPMKTPGVYIVEKNAFPNSVVQVATAVPAFIGYTERAMNGNKSLHMQPWRITTMAEFTQYFGDAHNPRFSINKRPEGENAEPGNELSPEGVMEKDSLPRASFEFQNGDAAEIYDLKLESTPYCLYGAMRLFFQNGGGACYIVSIGSYKSEDDPSKDGVIDGDKMILGIKTLIKEQEPTMVVIPETTRLTRANAVKVQQQMLMHCGDKMKNRVAILDIFGGYRSRQDPKGDPIATFRNDIGINQLNYGTAYYPWVDTSIFQSRDFTFKNITAGESRQQMIKLMRKSANPNNALPDAQAQLTNQEIAQTAEKTPPPADEKRTAFNEEIKIALGTDDLDIKPGSLKLEGDGELSEDGRKLKVDNVGVWEASATTGTLTFEPAVNLNSETEVKVKYAGEYTDGTAAADEISIKVHAPEPTIGSIDQTMRTIAPIYTEIMNEITKFMNTMSPASAMAGIYTMVDNSRGVWKAPANVSLNSVTAPTVNISHDDQEDLNVTPMGKSINAIRPFVGEGTLVWGARTLDGNSLDWRYISVRRTMIMLEESIRLAAKAYVFEPNVANTWVTIRSMIENFLTGIWKQGGLAGAVPSDAFSVQVGLGETMTPVDILEGILRVTVLVAISRPAEFIEITFQQQMQKS